MSLDEVKERATDVQFVILPANEDAKIGTAMPNNYEYPHTAALRQISSSKLQK